MKPRLWKMKNFEGKLKVTEGGPINGKRDLSMTQYRTPTSLFKGITWRDERLPNPTVLSRQEQLHPMSAIHNCIGQCTAQWLFFFSIWTKVVRNKVLSIIQIFCNFWLWRVCRAGCMIFCWNECIVSILPLQTPQLSVPQLRVHTSCTLPF